MEPNVSLNGIFEERLQEVDLLNNATLLINHTPDVNDIILECATEVFQIKQGTKKLGQVLKTIRRQIDDCKAIASVIEQLDKEILHMYENVPISLIRNCQEYEQTSSQHVPTQNKIQNHGTEAAQQDNPGNSDSMCYAEAESRTPAFEDCKKRLFKEVEVFKSIDPISKEEFAKIPKYIIGRLTFETLDSLISTINQVLKAKYSLLSLGRNGARKKGDLDLYLQYQKEQTAVADGKTNVYFFNADDYLRYTKTKLDKTKLNLIAALRHCKRMREHRCGKSVQYVVN